MPITLTDNQIQFSNITVPGKNMGAVIGKSNYKNASCQSIDDEYSGVIQKPSPLINAVDIDWNGANLYGTTGIWPTNTNPTIVLNESSTITLKTIRQ